MKDKEVVVRQQNFRNSDFTGDVYFSSLYKGDNKKFNLLIVYEEIVIS